jgi:L-erythro-3,5-diaminohexanoate dehydrogenase
MMGMTSSPLGLHRVSEPGPAERGPAERGPREPGSRQPGPAEPRPGPRGGGGGGGGGTVLPQAAWRLDPDPRIQPDEVRVDVERLNLDAASFRQIRESTGGAPDAMRAAVLAVIGTRGKMHNPVTGSGGMLTGAVAEVGPRSPLGLRAGMRIATLVSLSLTPLAITDGLACWDASSEQIPCEGHAILFARSIAVPLPDDLPMPLALAVFDVCGAPALTRRVVSAYRTGRGFGDAAGPGARAGDRAGDTAGGGIVAADSPGRPGPVVAIVGAAGKSGSLSAAAARAAGAAAIIGVVPSGAEAALLRESGLADAVVLADARDPVGLADAVAEAGGPADVTVVCVDVPGCEGGAILATAPGGTIVFFSMATSFSAAALGAEGMAADVTMLIGNGYAPGHAELALNLIRTTPAVRTLFERRIFHDPVAFSVNTTDNATRNGRGGAGSAEPGAGEAAMTEGDAVGEGAAVNREADALTGKETG